MCLREGFKKIILWGVEETELCGERGKRSYDKPKTRVIIILPPNKDWVTITQPNSDNL